MKKLINITGRRFGSVVAVRQVGNCQSGDAKWEFACDCGKSFSANGYKFRNGKRSACPTCANRAAQALREKHGMSGSVEHRIWAGILTRCNNKNASSYPDYGGRGIRVCPEWMTDFLAFYACLGPRPSPRHSIDRVDVNGDYEPGNCRWATPHEQANNTRTNVRYAELSGKSTSEVAQEIGISYGGLRNRLLSGKHENLFKPNKRRGSITYCGVTDTLDGWSRRTGIKPSTIAMRIGQYRWPVHKALTENGDRLDLHKPCSTFA